MAVGWCGRIGGSTMPCESCAAQFTVFKRKRACCECDRYYCSKCLWRGMCAPCRILSTRPSRDTIASLKVRDLQCFLQRQNVSTRGCVEKEELVRLCESHVNSTMYRRRGQRAGAGPFSNFTNNINDFINSAFDLRNSNPDPPPERRYFNSGCFNSTHEHTQIRPPTTTPPRPNPERFTTTPGGETDIRVPVPDLVTPVSQSSSDENTRVDTADCFEVEDVEESGWEFVNRPADPLPNDSSEILQPVTRDGGARHPVASSLRAVSEADIDRLEPHRLEPPSPDTDSASLQDEPLPRDRPTQYSHSTFDSASLQEEAHLTHHDTSTTGQISLERVSEVAELERLSVKQLKQLLARNRVEFRGCVERGELLQRAATLLRNQRRGDVSVDELPLDECCKICMAAPLECVLLECGHIAACTRCSKQLAECPICRQYVVRAVRFFRS